MVSPLDRRPQTTVLKQLADLLRQRDDIDARIASIVGRSARQSDVGEFIASHVFDIELAPTTTNAGFDGWFRSGPLAGKTVDIKTYGDAQAGIDIGRHPCDAILVLSGPRRPMVVGHYRWCITEAYVFDRARLLATLAERGMKTGVATSIRKADLRAVQVFPTPARSHPSSSPTPGESSSHSSRSTQRGFSIYARRIPAPHSAG